MKTLSRGWGILFVGFILAGGAGFPVFAGPVLDDFSGTSKWKGPYGPPESEYPGASVSITAEDGIATLSHSTTGYAYTDGDFIIDFSSYEGLIVEVTELTPNTYWRVQFPEYYSDADTFDSVQTGTIFVPFPEPLAGTGTYSHPVRLAVLAAPEAAGPTSVSFDSISLGRAEDIGEGFEPSRKDTRKEKKEEREKQTTAQDTGQGTKWGTVNMYATISTSPEGILQMPHIQSWYWTGDLYLFSQKPMDVIEDIWAVRPRNGGDSFGVGLDWVQPLPKGFTYKFDFKMRTPPDFVVVDGNRIPDKDCSFVIPDPADLYIKGVFSFSYTSLNDSPGRIYFVRDKSQDPIDFYPHTPEYVLSGWAAQCYRKGAGEPRDYERWEPPYEITKTKRVWARQPKGFGEFREYKKPAIKYEKDPDFEVTGMLYWVRNREGFYELCKDYGIDGYLMYVSKHEASAGWKDKEQLELGMKYGVDTFVVVEVVSPGKYYWKWDPQDADEKKVADGITSEGIEMANLITDTLREAKVYLMYVEDECAYSLYYMLEKSPLYEYSNENVFSRYSRLIEYYQKWNEEIRSRLKHPEQVEIYAQYGASCFPSGISHKISDIPLYDNINRQNINLLMANARGGGRAYGKKWGTFQDQWAGMFPDTVSPEEFEQIFHVYFFGGSNHFYPEFPLMNADAAGKVVVNSYGERLLDSLRVIRRHPKRGEPVVKIGAVRGFGDTFYDFGCQATSGGWSAPQEKRITLLQQANEDYAAVNDWIHMRAFFPDFGWLESDRIISKLSRWCTGTPYGPVDMIPWDAPFSHLKKFDLLVYMGINGMEKEQYENIREFVKDGGNLIISVGQLLAPGDEPRKLHPAENYEEFLGVTIKTEKGGQPLEGSHFIKAKSSKDVHFRGIADTGKVTDYYQLIVRDAEVIARASNADPIVVVNNYGKGKVYLYATRAIIAVSPEEVNERFIASVAEGSKILNLEPGSEWIEYIVQRKEDTYQFIFFNHGRGWFPSNIGKDHGEWSGKVEVNLDMLEDLKGQKLEAWTVSLDDLNIGRIPIKVSGGQAGFDLQIDKRIEVIVGPKGKAKKQFFD